MEIKNTYTKKDREIIQKSLEVAIEAHKDQVRKIDGRPYIFHPTEVANYLMAEGMPAYLVAAGNLHDVIEDTDYDEKSLRRIFDNYDTRIVDYVISVTENKSLIWEERKVDAAIKVYNSDFYTKVLKCADCLSNINATLKGYDNMGDKIWSCFNKGKELQKEKEQIILNAIKEISILEIYKELEDKTNILFNA